MFHSLLRFTIRDMLWLTVVVALVVVWWLDRQRLDATLENLAESELQTQAAKVSNEFLRDSLRTASRNPGTASINQGRDDSDP